jgi:hypothetical protein
MLEMLEMPTTSNPTIFDESLSFNRIKRLADG